MDWNDLRHFLAAARAGSLAGAARELRVEHTTVSRRIAALESDLGTKLFTRTPDGLVLTDAGKGVLPLAESAAQAMDAVERHATASDDRVDGTVRLSTSEVFSGIVTRRLGELRQRHPQLVLEVNVTNRSVDLVRGEADLAIRAAPVTGSELISRKLFAAGWTLYATKAYLDARGTPDPYTALKGHDVIVYDESMAKTPGGLWLEQHAAGANVVMKANSIVAATNAALSGLGIAVIPCLLGGREQELVRITDALVGFRDIWLLVHPDLARVARVRAVMQFIVELVEREKVMLTGRSTD